ncbi:unnamed protein product [Notodromas monacha]|uniref:Hamartin n=1 Tax=Notodromas monacha TaxID=399045 RepID=A0A7R9GF65_9CRUS|nr:unnamed protein product [Notodromas monacha]CAG0919027.1 unnamed protein product [Notodromas monacha]
MGEHASTEVESLFEDLVGSNDDVRVTEVKNILHELLNNTRDAWVMNGLVDFCFATKSSRCMDLICDVGEPHDKHLFDNRVSSLVTFYKPEAPEGYPLFLRFALYRLFQRLYGMYPCQFLSFLRRFFGSSGSRMQIFTQTILPFIERAKLHPLLFISGKESETAKDRWMKMEKHDIIVECEKVWLDSPDSWSCAEIDAPSSCNVAFMPFAKHLLHQRKGEASLGPAQTSLAWTPSRSLINSPPPSVSNDFFQMASSTARGSLSVPPTPLPEGNGRWSVPVSAPVTPRAMDSPPEAAIEATPENTPVTTPNQELERAAERDRASKPKITAIGRLGFQKPPSMQAFNQPRVSASSPPADLRTPLYNERLAKVAAERLPQKPEDTRRMTSPVKFYESSGGAVGGSGGLPRPVPVKKRPQQAPTMEELQLAKSSSELASPAYSASDEDAEVSNIISNRKIGQLSRSSSGVGRTRRVSSRDGAKQEVAYQPLAHSSSTTSVSSQNSRSDSVIHDPMEDVASTTLMDVEARRDDELLRRRPEAGPVPVQMFPIPPGMLDGLVQEVHRFRFHSQCETGSCGSSLRDSSLMRAFGARYGSRITREEKESSEEDGRSSRGSNRRRRKSNPDTKREKRSVKVDLTSFSDGNYIVTGTVKRRKKKRKTSSSTQMALPLSSEVLEGKEETAGEEGDDEEEEEGRKYDLATRHSSGTQTIDMTAFDAAVSQIFSLGVWPCLRCASRSEEMRVRSPFDNIDAYLTTFLECNRSDRTCLEKELAVLRLLFVYERYARDAYAERSRRLLGRAKQAHLLQEQNAALQDQFAVCESLNQQLKAENALLRESSVQGADRLTVAKFEKLIAEANKTSEKLTEENQKTRQELSDAIEARARADRELGQAKRELWRSEQQVEQLKAVASKSSELQAKAEELEKELCKQSENTENVRTQVEAVLKRSGSVIRRSGSIGGRSSMAEFMKNRKVQIESDTNSLEASRARIADLEMRLHEKAVVIEDLKAVVKSREEEYNEKTMALEEKYKNSKAVICTHETQLLSYAARVENLQRKLQTSLRRKTASADSLDGGRIMGSEDGHCHDVGIPIVGAACSRTPQHSSSWGGSRSVGTVPLMHHQLRPSLSPGPGGLYDLEQSLFASSPPTVSTCSSAAF